MYSVGAVVAVARFAVQSANAPVGGSWKNLPIPLASVYTFVGTLAPPKVGS